MTEIWLRYAKIVDKLSTEQLRLLQDILKSNSRMADLYDNTDNLFVLIGNVRA